MKLMTHIVAGYPNLKESENLAMLMIDSGVSVLEIQIPFSDPVADGKTIAEANRQSLESGTRVEDCFTLLKNLKKKTKIPIYFMTYFNIPFVYGLEEFCKKCKENECAGLIIPDMPLDEESQDHYLSLCEKYELNPIQVISPLTTGARMKKIAKLAKGFVYCMARMGTTGVRKDLDQNLKEYLSCVNSIVKLPLAVGFGISAKEHLNGLSEFADFAVIGSKILDLYKEGLNAVRTFILDMVESAHEFPQRSLQSDNQCKDKQRGGRTSVRFVDTSRIGFGGGKMANCEGAEQRKKPESGGSRIQNQHSESFTRSENAKIRSGRIPEISKNERIIIAGPCALESEEQAMIAAQCAKMRNVDFVRMCLFKPRTKPGFEGLGESGIPILVKAAKMGVNPATEVTNPDDATKIIDAVMAATKTGKLLIWIGSRNQNHFIQREIARLVASNKRVTLMLKNQPWFSKEHWEGIVEHALSGGIDKDQLIVCHRGFTPGVENPENYRNVPDFQMAMEVKQSTGLKMLFDPSHTGGTVPNVLKITGESQNFDFDGIIIEVHHDPSCALTDAKQQLTWDQFDDLLDT